MNQVVNRLNLCKSFHEMDKFGYSVGPYKMKDTYEMLSDIEFCEVQGAFEVIKPLLRKFSISRAKRFDVTRLISWTRELLFIFRKNVDSELLQSSEVNNKYSKEYLGRLFNELNAQMEIGFFRRMNGCNYPKLKRKRYTIFCSKKIIRILSGSVAFSQQTKK